MSVRVRVTMKKAADAAFLSGSLLEGQRAELSSDRLRLARSCARRVAARCRRKPDSFRRARIEEEPKSQPRSRRSETPSRAAQCTQQKMRPSDSTPCPITRQPQCAQIGASA